MGLHADDSDPARLERIEEWLGGDDPDRRGIALKVLRDEIGPDSVVDLRRHLGKEMAEKIRLLFEERLKEIILGRLGELEERVHEFEDARRLCRDLRSRLQASPDEKDTEERLVDARRERLERRQQVEELHQQVQGLGLSLAPALRVRIEMGGAASDLVERLRARLLDDIATLARSEHPIPPTLGNTSWIERRSLAPLLEELQRDGDRRWQTLERALLEEAIDQIESFDPDLQQHGRRLLLDLGSAGQDGIERWSKEAGNLLPRAVRSHIVERNRLRVPPGFDVENALPIESYLARTPAGRRDLIHRLRWVAGNLATPVLAALLEIEEDLTLRVEAASTLARLSDRRGADFLRQLGIAEAVGVEATSRSVLVRAAVERRNNGDPEGALTDLLALLRRLPGDFRLHYEIGLTALRLRRLPLSVDHFRRALDLSPADSNTLYNLACVHSLAGDIDEALEALSLALQSGFSDLPLARRDKDLEALRKDPRFEGLLEGSGGG